ncbi:anthocyanidin 3-O-glucoside 2''-O-glucosyltransferase-like [Cryptomeria japonica]|uniref:anthocyanidin 3-O-glucoside 2''-O-glucosyltransferase-like n=1 Tax=Cryptomeria japonica TaxID=3369 RepID=UPI0027D9E44B|nr:anthocyanidin 3-O-glucoside 2''-O-glucosyltransferase-like [Cryptomeria japonica]
MADDRQLHVVMFPWFAQGHITPLLDLAKSLLTSGLRISFVSTPANIAWIKKKIVPGIELVELQLPSVDGVPAGVESTKALCWTPWVADKMGIPTINFMVVGMASMSFAIGQHRQRLPDIPTTKDLTVPLPRFPSLVIRFRTFKAQKESKGLTFMNRLSISVEESWATLSNTCRELEGKFVDYFKRSTGRFMFPVGISMPSLPPQLDADRCLAYQMGAELHRVSEDRTPSRGLGLQSLRFGVPIVSLPIQFEQPLVARLIANELNMRVEVKRNEDSSFTKEDIASSFTKEDVAKAVRAVMVEEEGKWIKSNVEEISRVLTSNNCQWQGGPCPNPSHWRMAHAGRTTVVPAGAAAPCGDRRGPQPKQPTQNIEYRISDDDLGDSDDEYDEGYDTEANVEVDPHTTESSKRKRKTS